MALKDTQNRTIVFPIAESSYQTFMQDQPVAHQQIKEAFDQHPELFPPAMSKGYMLNGRTRVSQKLGLQLRKIKVSGVSYQLRPSFLLPAMRAKTNEVSKPLFLLRFGVPFWALAFVFGRNPMWWYRLYLCLGRSSIVGTTVYKTDCLPADVLADEHHVRVRGRKAYIATTIGQGCILGVQACARADEATLAEGYGVFQQEALDANPSYQPVSVNTDGWPATQKVWQSLFPTIAVVECFLHAFIKVRDRATKKLEGFFDTAATKIWDCYRAESKGQLAQQIRRLREWTKKHLPQCAMKDNILKLCAKKKRWIQHLDFPSAHRTSNMLDRVMRAMSRHAFNSQMFHATIDSTTANFRAFALLYNFSPSCPAVTKLQQQLTSPAARLNSFAYHQDWIQNLLIAASMGG